MKKIEIKLKNCQYEIVYSNIEDAASNIIPNHLKGSRVAIITDVNASKKYLPIIKNILLKLNIKIIEIILPSGEKNKDLKVVTKILARLLKEKFERQDAIIALGGGVIGDLAGFVSAIIHRGVDFINIPTTLLAQVDSSIGGKTGVNSTHGKNLIGSFKQPKVVICDINTLSSLPKRELLAGYAELVKHALIGDAALFTYLENNVNLIFDDKNILEEALIRSANVKAGIVMKDELEDGIRAHLNLGHTFAHAIESASQYDGTILHGEAVSLGIIMAYKTSMMKGICSNEQVNIVERHFKKIGLKTTFGNLLRKKLNANLLIDLMKNDKKVKQGYINFIIPNKIGQVSIRSDIDQKIIESVIDTTLSS
ncbi:MAG: 3-dehydroquinate synthase [Rhodobiaceae bacterium]|nr:3-dehydroquinate synthase [Rhodobiaceae bacterium]|tara:strand:+ start:14560 stop:15660 length:1101 start_codon:yes stop_codon:yes gene_type:complete